jgi:prevent-host-death family protein
MKIASVADIKARFSAYLKASEEGPIIVTRNGKPAAVLLSMKDPEELEGLILAYSPKFQRILRAAQQQIKAGAGIPHDEIWKEMEEESTRKSSAS